MPDCGCGCGCVAKSTYLRGHHNRLRSRRDEMSAQCRLPLPKCACGCGQQLHSRGSKWARGHFPISTAVRRQGGLSAVSDKGRARQSELMMERMAEPARMAAMLAQLVVARTRLPHGPEHHAWTGGASPSYGPSWSAIAVRVIERDEHRCVRCAAATGLVVHH